MRRSPWYGFVTDAAVITPITSPSAFARGLPEWTGLGIGVSVDPRLLELSAICAFWSSGVVHRPQGEDDPGGDRGCSTSPPAFPTPTTASPTAGMESPMSAVGRPEAPRSLIRAMSCVAS